MSIQICKNPKTYTVDNLKNKIIINSYDSLNKNLIELNTNNDITHNETYIQIGKDIKIGSSNNLFVIKDTFDNNLFNLSSDVLLFQQNVSFDNTINILDRFVCNDLSTVFYNNVEFHLNNQPFNIFNYDKSIFNINDDNTFIHSCFSSNLSIYNTLYTNHIKPFNDNIIIDGLLLKDYKAIDGTFKNNIIIDFNQLQNADIIDNHSIFINKNINTCNFLHLSTNHTHNMSINYKGYIEIGSISQNDVPLNIISQDNFIIKSNDNFSLNKYGHLSIGNSIDSKSLLLIHRNDNNIQNDILNQPLSIFSMDYNPINNFITSNIIDIPFHIDNIILNKNHIVNEFSYNFIVSFELNNFDNTHNVLWNTHSLPYDIHSFSFSNIDFVFKITDIDYNQYNLKILDFYNYPSLISNNSYKLIAGFWYDNENIIDEHLQFLISNDSFSNSSYSFKHIQFSHNIFHDYASFDDYSIHFDVFILVQNSPNILYMSYINTNPILQPPPDFIQFSSNNQTIASFDAFGLFDIPSINIRDISTINQLNVSKIINDVDYDFHNLYHVKNIDTQNIFVDGSITIGDVKISKEHGIELNQDFSIESKINSVNISNINSPFFKYNNDFTSFLNKVSIGSHINDILHIRNNNDYELLIQGKGLSINNDKLVLNAFDEPFLNFQNSNIIRFETLLNDNVDANKQSLSFSSLSLYNNSSTVFNSFNDIDIFSFGSDNFLCLNTNSIPYNKFSIGVPSSFLINNNKETQYWYQYFKDVLYFQDTTSFNLNNLFLLHNIDNTTVHDYMKHTFNVFGSSRFSNTNNITLAEIRDDDLNSTMTVYGSLKCSKKIINISPENGISYSSNSDALIVDGNACIDGKVYTTGGVASLSDIKMKTNIQHIRSSIEKIRSLNGYTYQRIDTKQNETGLIAQEVEQVLPQVVHLDKNNNKTIAYGNLSGLIVEAIKNIDNRLQILENQFFSNS